MTHIPEEEWHFLRTLEDLRRCSASGDVYDNVQASLLVRRLMLDSHSLIAKANRRYSLRLRYQVADSTLLFKDDGTQLAWFAGSELVPGGGPPVFERGVIELSQDQFLKFVVGRSGDIKLTVYDTVDTCANNLGGVHLDAKLEERGAALKEISTAFADVLSMISFPTPGLNPLTLVGVTMRAIGTIVAKGLEPLEQRIRAL